MKQTICDKCKKYIGDYDNAGRVEFKPVNPLYSAQSHIPLNEVRVDLCSECYDIALCYWKEFFLKIC